MTDSVRRLVLTSVFGAMATMAVSLVLLTLFQAEPNLNMAFTVAITGALVLGAGVWGAVVAGSVLALDMFAARLGAGRRRWLFIRATTAALVGAAGSLAFESLFPNALVGGLTGALLAVALCVLVPILGTRSRRLRTTDSS